MSRTGLGYGGKVDRGGCAKFADAVDGYCHEPTTLADDVLVGAKLKLHRGRSCILQLAEDAVFFIAYAGIEIKRIRIAKSDTVAEGNSPQSIKLQHVATLIVQSADKCACSRVVSINVAITKIAHQQIVTEDSESARSQSHSPRCIQHAVGNQ